MGSTLRSKIFKNDIYQKRFSKDFLTKKLIENNITVDTPQVSGVIKELQLNGMFIVIKNMNAPEGYNFQISNDFSIFKLHFGMAGSYSYTPRNQCKPLVKIPDFHYNMLYLPNINGRFDYKGSPSRSLEIIFTLELVKKIAGDNFKQILERIDSAIEKNKPLTFWKQARPISPDVCQILEEIMACPYTGQLKKMYLQSKLTALLIDFLIAANGNPKPDSKVKLPKTDFDSLLMVEHHIKSNLKKTLPIAKLAVLAGFNTSKLKRDFKRVHGTTIFKYITRLRMEKASELIRNEGLTVAQAAHEVGYTIPQHFTNAFKRTFGYLPSMLKK